MRRTSASCLTPARLGGALLAGALLAGTVAPAMNSPAAAQAQPPHAWLFGSWTGGLFPAPSNPSAQACLAAPTVIFARDVVLRAILTDVTYVERVVATARTTPGETNFEFAPTAPSGPGNTLFGNATAPSMPIGFGCADPNSLRVVRRSDNEIMFPDCADFPNPLVRCPAR